MYCCYNLVNLYFLLLMSLLTVLSQLVICQSLTAPRPVRTVSVLKMTPVGVERRPLLLLILLTTFFELNKALRFEIYFASMNLADFYLPLIVLHLKNKRIVQTKNGIYFNEIYLKEGLHPKFANIYIYIYTHTYTQSISQLLLAAINNCFNFN